MASAWASLAKQPEDHANAWMHVATPEPSQPSVDHSTGWANLFAVPAVPNAAAGWAALGNANDVDDEDDIDDSVDIVPASKAFQTSTPQ